MHSFIISHLKARSTGNKKHALGNQNCRKSFRKQFGNILYGKQHVVGCNVGVFRKYTEYPGNYLEV